MSKKRFTMYLFKDGNILPSILRICDSKKSLPYTENRLYKRYNREQCKKCLEKISI